MLSAAPTGQGPTFNASELVAHDVGFTTTNGIATDGAGSVLIGPAGQSPDQDFGITRFNADGSLDSSFGTAGVTTIRFGTTDDVPSSLVVLSDGKILVGGTATTIENGGLLGSEFALAEFNSDGTLDRSFGHGTGEVLQSLSARAGVLSDDFLNALAVGKSGLIYAGGSSDTAGRGADFAVAVFGPHGSLDTGYGNDGHRFIDFDDADDVINSLELQRNGELVAAGSASINGVVEVALVRFFSSGALDLNFGNQGHVTTSVRGVYDTAASALIMPDSKIVIGGASATAAGAELTTDFLIARYTAKGRLDSSFAGDGSEVTSFGGPSAITQLELQSDGEVFASGKTAANLTAAVVSQPEVAIARYGPEGIPNAIPDSVAAYPQNTTGRAADNIFGVLDLSNALLTTANLHAEPLTGSSIESQEVNSLGSAFGMFVGSKQGVIAGNPGGGILAAGSSGSSTVVAVILKPGLDLTLSIVDAHPVPSGRRAIESLIISVTEIGTQAAIGVVKIVLNLQTDSAGDNPSQLFSVSEPIDLVGGASEDFHFGFRYPTSPPAGGYFIAAEVLDGRVGTDLNFKDNTDTRLIAVPSINLSGGISGATLTSKALSKVMIQISNAGNMLAMGRIDVELLLSTDGSAAHATKVIAAPIQVDLAPEESIAYPLRFRLMRSFSAGVYTLLLLIDPAESLGLADHSDSLVADINLVTVSAM